MSLVIKFGDIMRKRNGMTLIEIMVSVVLISIVMVFIFNLLLDLKQEENISSDKAQDQLNRSVITKTIQDDFLDREIKAINNCNDGNYIACFRFTFFDNTYGFIKVDENNFYYEQSENPNGDGSSLERWELKTTTYSDDYFYCYQENGNLYYLQFVFPVVQTINVLKSKMVFDIELLFMGEKKEGMEIPKDGSELGIEAICKTIT